MRASPRWLRWLVLAGIAWAGICLAVSLASDRTPRNLTLVIAIAASGAYTLLQHLVFLVGLAFWQYIPVYSSIVLAPAWVLDEAAARRIEPVVSRRARFAPGLAPFAWLVVYAAYLLVLLVVMGIAGAASGHAAPR